VATAPWVMGANDSSGGFNGTIDSCHGNTKYVDVEDGCKVHENVS
jgi:hypothetical protein